MAPAGHCTGRLTGMVGYGGFEPPQGPHQDPQCNRALIARNVTRLTAAGPVGIEPTSVGLETTILPLN